MKKKWMGIDPGKTGVIVTIDEDRVLDIKKIPLVKDEVDITQLLYIFEHMRYSEHCVLEDVHSIFGVSAKANFQFGRVLGMIEVAIKTANIPLSKIKPMAWQKEMWQGINPVEINTGKKTKDGNIKYKVDTKATSYLAAKNLFPTQTFILTEKSKKPDNNAIDAALMAEYCRRKFK